MLKTLFAILLTLVVILVFGGFLLPTATSVERSRVMDHPPEVIFDVLADFRHFPQWSPWLDEGAITDYRFEGPDSGVGATLVWREQHEAGASRMWITDADRPRHIEVELEFGDKPARSYYRIEPHADGQQVTWGMQMQVGSFDLVGRYLGLILPRLVGRSFADGLERLDAYLDSAPPGEVPVLPEPGLNGEAPP